MSSEMGLPGVVLNILLHVIPLWMVFRVRRRILSQEDRLAVGIVFTTVCIMMLLYITGPHTMAVSVLWILVVMLSYLFATAIRYDYSFRAVRMKPFVIFLMLLSLLFFIRTYDNVFGREGYTARQLADWWPYRYEQNCYLDERLNTGEVLP